ncbi:preprotein translocase subunit YajC [Rubripirellula amarantea]|nr:preprotein translocase subunit YajC [Rubripirellula amarantea]
MTPLVTESIASFSGRSDAWTSVQLVAQGSAALFSQAPAAEPGPSFLSPLTLVAGFFFLFYFIVIAPERRKKAEEAKMMASLKKNDRVVTIGGIHGVVAAISESDGIVTLKVDESGNARIRVNRSAIGQIVTPKDAKDEKEAT